MCELLGVVSDREQSGNGDVRWIKNIFKKFLHVEVIYLYMSQSCRIAGTALIRREEETR